MHSDDFSMVLHLRADVLQRLRDEYPPGTKVELIQMCDPYRDMPCGLKGIVEHVDDAGGIHINWENGSSLAALHGIDVIKKCE